MSLMYDAEDEALALLFDKWLGSADHNIDCERIHAIDIDKFFDDVDTIENDLVSHLHVEQIQKIKLFLRSVIDGENTLSIRRFFEANLISARRPSDEKLFACRIIDLIEKNAE